MKKRALAITVILVGFMVLTIAALKHLAVQVAEKEISMTGEKYSNEVLLQCLTPLQFNVTRKSGTEQPFNNKFWNNHREGFYVDIISGEPLFSTQDKFDSGAGWLHTVLRSEKINPQQPIVIFRGFGDTVLKMKIQSDRIASLISKPYRFGQLREVLKSVIVGDDKV